MNFNELPKRRGAVHGFSDDQDRKTRGSAARLSGGGAADPMLP
jgi:hypothetical protein